MLIYLFTLLLATAPSYGAGTAVEQNTAQEQAQDRLIDKLAHLNLNLPPDDTSKTAITLRLADLHAERGRRLSMKELDSGCTTCKAGTKDREKAIRLYTEVMPKLENDQKARVMIQVGHLSEMIGQESKAIEVYGNLVHDKDPKVAVDAELSLAEMKFKKRNYKDALVHYQKVIASPVSTQKGLAMYRAGWCLFNQDQIEPAVAMLKKVLNSPEYLSRGNAGIVSVDKQFQEEVSRDLATFISRRPFNQAEMEDLYKLSPDNARLVHISYLASEYERLGQVPAAIAAWRYVIQRQPKPEARLEGHVHLAQLQAAHQQRKEANEDFETSLSLWQQMGSCTTDTCKQLRVRLKQFVVEWNGLEKKNPSKDLLEAYQKYLEVFPTEVDMRLWEAQVAGQIKEYDFAVQENLKTASLISEEIKTNPKAVDKTKREWLELSLLAAIENAEMSKKPDLLDKSTQAYLDLSIDKKKEVDVRYQRAMIAYEAGNHAVAAEQMRMIALDKKAPADIRNKAANLTLDSLVLLKDDTKIEAAAKELSAALPSQAKEFSAVARKSVLTQSSSLAGANDLDKAWVTLTRFDVNGASQEEKTTYLKNKLILAEKLKKYREARDAADQLLRQPGLSTADAQFALSRKAWLAELQFDFATALAATEKVAAPEVDPATRSLRLALLADLAEKDSKPFYKKYINESKDKEKTVAVTAQLVRSSSDPIKEFNAYKSVLAQNPEFYTEVGYEIYAKTGKQEMLTQITSQPKMLSTPFGKAALRTESLAKYQPMVDKFAKSTIDTSSQKKLGASLKSRVALITEAEKLAAKAVDQQEWASQIVFLSLLAKENERFYNEVLSLPVPEGLSPEEEQQYLSLLSQQAAPHQTKANDIKTKLKEIYANKEAFNKFREGVAAQREPIRKVFVSEMALVRSALPAEQASLLGDVGGPAVEAKPSLAEVESARQKVRETPFDSQKITELMKLEKQMGRNSMVSYLQTRLDGLSNETTKKN
jgi:hypothetical protein